MQSEGTLAKWDDGRGFGFIAPRLGGQEIFIHVSSFPRDGRRPRIGETLWFDIEADARGRKRAVRVVRPTRIESRVEARRERSPPKHGGRLARTLISTAILAGIAAYGYDELSRRSEARRNFVDTAPPAAAELPERRTESASFHCDGRMHCSQMTSCAEATYFLRNCPGVKMDGDRDGIPCEEQWCSSPLSR